ncbi:hypothetical protein HRbin30_00758 [bacterium HR30]|nr:hypothetical protein HRbin30_00758 [bacterium HR30]
MTGDSWDISDRIERIETVEDDLGVRIDGLLAYLGVEADELKLTINGELHAMEDDTYPEAVELVAAAYDERGRVLAIHTAFLYPFRYFDVFSIRLAVPTEPAKIRIFPRGR